MNSAQFLEQMKTFAERLTHERQIRPYLSEEFSKFLDENYSVYLDSTPKDCLTIRASFSNNRDFENYLFAYTRRAAAQLQTTGEDVWLWRGLISVSLENCGIDYRDTLMSLAELFVIAERHNINPKPAFEKVARLSSKNKPRGGETPLKEILMNFEGYAILEERRQMKTSYLSTSSF